MRRGTTPTHIFKTKVDLTEATEMFITYEQDDKTVVEKSIKDITIEQEQLTVTLSQTDTLAFSTIGEVEIQCRVKMPAGEALASQIIKRPVGRILKEGII